MGVALTKIMLMVILSFEVALVYCLVKIPPKVVHAPKTVTHKKHPTNILHKEKHVHGIEYSW